MFARGASEYLLRLLVFHSVCQRGALLQNTRLRMFFGKIIILLVIQLVEPSDNSDVRKFCASLPDDPHSII